MFLAVIKQAASVLTPSPDGAARTWEGTRATLPSWVPVYSSSDDRTLAQWRRASEVAQPISGREEETEVQP